MAEKKFLDYEGLQELVLKIKEYVGDAGHIEFKGAVANVAALPALSGQKVGWMYTVQAAGKTTADFTDGAGKTIAANSEVAAVNIEGTTENTIFSANNGSTYVSTDLAAYTPTGSVGSGTKLCEVYIADGTETHLTEGTWYVTGDGSSFFEVTALGDTFADFTKTPVSNEDAITELGGKYTGSAFADLNKYTETVTEEAMKWCLLGPVFDVSDKLTYVTDAMPANPQDGDIVMYLGDTTYEYNEVTPEGSENPKALGWYVSNGAGGYVLTEDETVQPGTTYYTKDEEFVQGVVYEYDETEGWTSKTSGDTMTPISNAEIDILFA